MAKKDALMAKIEWLKMLFGFSTTTVLGIIGYLATGTDIKPIMAISAAVTAVILSILGAFIGVKVTEGINKLEEME